MLVSEGYDFVSGRSRASARRAACSSFDGRSGARSKASRTSSSSRSSRCSRAATCCSRTCPASARRRSRARSARAVGGEMRRVQFTSDLLPSDVLGVSVYDQRRAEFVLRPGPIFTNVLLADEINRASPRTQSALLEAMSDGQVSLDGTNAAAARAVLRGRHAEPAGFRGHVPAARVAARSLHDAASHRLPAAARRDAPDARARLRPHRKRAGRARSAIARQHAARGRSRQHRRRARRVPAGADDGDAHEPDALARRLDARRHEPFARRARARAACTADTTASPTTSTRSRCRCSLTACASPPTPRATFRRATKRKPPCARSSPASPCRCDDGASPRSDRPAAEPRRTLRARRAAAPPEKPSDARAQRLSSVASSGRASCRSRARVATSC